MLPLAQVSASHTENEGSVGNQEFELESCPCSIHPAHVNQMLAWPELHLSNLPSHKQLFSHCRSAVKVQMSHLSRAVVALG